MKKRLSFVADGVLKEIDAFISGEERKDVLRVQPYSNLINTKPFTSRRLKARIANRIVDIPLRILKKSFAGYFTQKDIALRMEQDRMDLLESKIDYLIDNTNDQVDQLIDTKVYEIAKLNDRLKSEILAEINGGEPVVSDVVTTKVKIINQKKYNSCKRINLGSGSVTMEEYVNIDHREIKGVDVVADVADLPYHKNSLDEIYLSHVVEHFTEHKLKELVKYWYSLLAMNGVMRIIVPDIASMARGYSEGSIAWDSFRRVILGAQDYGSDYHYNAFSVDYLKSFLNKELPGAVVDQVADARPNGECLELEVTIKKSVQ